MAADCNPNIIEVLFTDEAEHIQVFDEGLILLENRDLFLSKAAKHRFSGYAMSQLRRLNNHHAWLINPPKAPPTREEFDLPRETLIAKGQLAAIQAEIQKKVDGWGSTIFDGLEESIKVAVTNKVSEFLAEMRMGKDEQYIAAARIIGLDNNVIYLLKKEREYLNAYRTWISYQTWLVERNVQRATLEAEHGYDTKHAMHLVRLMRMCKEILVDGKVIVKRPDREELLAIRNGAWTYEQLIEWAAKQDAELDAAMVNSKLPHTADKVKLDNLCQRLLGILL